MPIRKIFRRDRSSAGTPPVSVFESPHGSSVEAAAAVVSRTLPVQGDRRGRVEAKGSASPAKLLIQRQGRPAMGFRRAAMLLFAALALVVVGACASVSHDPDSKYNAVQLKEMGEKLLASGQHGPALKYLTLAEEKRPKDPVVQYDLARALEERGLSAQAEERYQRALVLKPDYSEARNALGVFYARQNRPDKAEEQFQRAINDPFYGTPHLPMFNLGLIYEGRGESERALQLYQQAVRLHPKYGAAYYRMGLVLENMRRADEAKTAYAQAINSEPNLVEAHLRFGVMSYQAGELDNALYSLSRVVKLAPAYSTAATEARLYLNRLNSIVRTEPSKPSPSITASRSPNIEVMARRDLAQLQHPPETPPQPMAAAPSPTEMQPRTPEPQASPPAPPAVEPSTAPRQPEPAPVTAPAPTSPKAAVTEATPTPAPAPSAATEPAASPAQAPAGAPSATATVQPAATPASQGAAPTERTAQVGPEVQTDGAVNTPTPTQTEHAGPTPPQETAAKPAQDSNPREVPQGDTPSAQTPSPEARSSYIVQIGSFFNKKNAEDLRNRLAKRGFHASVKPYEHEVLGSVFVVQLRPINNTEDAARIMKRLEELENMKPIVIKVQPE
jgi:type IV pilus assembly protein PilF